MKKNWFLRIYMLFCGSMLATSLFAQGLLIEKKDGSTIKVPYELLERVTVYDNDNTPQPGDAAPTDLAECVKEDVAALQQLGKANPQLGIEGNDPSAWKSLNIVWEKNEAGLYAVSAIEIKAESKLENLALHFDAKKDAMVFGALKEIKIANAGVKELVVVDQPALEKVSLNGLDAAPIAAVNVQGGMALQHIAIENLPQATSVFIGGDSLLTVTLNNLPSLQEQSMLSFRRLYTENNIKDTRIEKLTLKGNFNKLNGLYLSDLGLKELALETTLPEATGISLNKNQLTGELNLKGFGKLANLNIRNNQLTGISISECPMLKEFDASTNKQLSNLVLDLPNLTYLDANESSLTALDITHLKSLKKLSVSNSQLATLTFNGTNAALERINLSNNQLTSFTLPAEVTDPYQMYLNNNRLKTLDLKYAANLEDLYISDNNLESFVMPDETETLATLECGGNHLTATFLRNVEANYTEISSLLAAPQTMLSRTDVAKRQVDASEEVNLGMEPYVVKWNGNNWEEIEIGHKDGIFTLPADGTYRVICTEDIFSNFLKNLEFSFDDPYLIGEIKQ